MTHDDLFRRLAADRVRRKFHLLDRERAFLERWGIEKVMRDARDILTRRIAPAEPKNDGRQTPWRNHPVFVAQHATATCCRGCIQTWHQIEKGHELTAAELDTILGAIEEWFERETRGKADKWLVAGG